jgi:hypothetical protein
MKQKCRKTLGLSDLSPNTLIKCIYLHDGNIRRRQRTGQNRTICAEIAPHIAPMRDSHDLGVGESDRVSFSHPSLESEASRRAGPVEALFPASTRMPQIMRHLGCGCSTQSGTAGPWPTLILRSQQAILTQGNYHIGVSHDTGRNPSTLRPRQCCME